ATNATQEEVVFRGQELCDLAETDEQRLLYRWAMEQLITHPNTRLLYELFEVPNALYEDREWENFARAFRRNPVDLAALAHETTPPRIADFNLSALIGQLLDETLTIPEADLKATIDHPPFSPGHGPPPLEL